MKSSDKTSGLGAGKSVSSLVKAISGEFEVVMGSPGRVKTCCSELKKQISLQPKPSEFEQLYNLLPLLPGQVLHYLP